MKKIMFLLGMVGTVVLMAPEVFASQIMGTPLHTDPGADERIRLAPLPEGYRFGQQLPIAIDLEVEWKPMGPGEPKNIYGIFIEPDGKTIKVVESHFRYIRGRRVWKARDVGECRREKGRRWRSWRRERKLTTENVWADKGASLVGVERGKVLFEMFQGTRYFHDWPLEVEGLLKTVFRGIYGQKAKAGINPFIRFFLARDPNNPEIMAFCTMEVLTASPDLISLFATIDGGENWIEINPLEPERRLSALAIRKEKETNKIEIFIGQMAGGRNAIHSAIIPRSAIQEVLAER